MDPVTAPGLYLPYVLARLERRAADSGLQVTTGPPASQETIARAASRLSVEFPPEVAAVYAQVDGLAIDDPPLEVLPLERLEFLAPDRLHFATVGGRHRLCLDTSELNPAGQWTVVAADTGSEITFTLGSFWCNKIWKWIDARRAFWTPWPWEPEP